MIKLIDINRYFKNGNEENHILKKANLSRLWVHQAQGRVL